MVNQDDTVYDVLGVGFGPANIALAVAMEDAKEEQPSVEPVRSLFLEQRRDSAWQDEMLLPGTDIQHHLLRDFATPRNPRSRFTFPCYLKEVGRLFDFGLLNANPSRTEWADYCRWVSEQLGDHVRYRYQVECIQPLLPPDDGAIEILKVTASDLVSQSRCAFLARNVVLATGRVPYVPDVFKPWCDDRVFHSHRFLSSLAQISADDVSELVVVGSGQSAIEIILYLLDHLPKARVTSIGRGSGFRLNDLGHFTNQIFSPPDVDYFHSLSRPEREAFLADVKLTNYSAVHLDVSRDLFWRMYEESVTGQPRIRVLKRSAVTGLTSVGKRLELLVEDVHTRDRLRIPADAVFVCTGYVEERVPSLLDGVSSHLLFDDDGYMVVDRDYGLRTTERMSAGLFMSGLTEHSHGISDSTSFSMMALRAERIMARLGRQCARGGEGVTSATIEEVPL